MNLTPELTIVIVAYIIQIIGFVITITTIWNKQDNRLSNLEKSMILKDKEDKELKGKVESLNKLYSKIELIESKQISQNDAMNITLNSLNSSINTLNQKLDGFSDSYNKLNTEIEVMKSKL